MAEHVYINKEIRNKVKQLFGDCKTEYIASLLSFALGVLENTPEPLRSKIIREVSDKAPIHRLFLLELPPYRYKEVKKE